MKKYSLLVLVFLLMSCASTPQSCNTEAERSPQSTELTEQEAHKQLDAVDRFSPFSGSW